MISTCLRVIGVQWNPITKGKKESGATVKGSRKSVGTGQRGPLLLERLKGPHVPDICSASSENSA